MNKILELDAARYEYGRKEMPEFQVYFRKLQAAQTLPGRYFWGFLFRRAKRKRMIELPSKVQIGPGLYIGHPYSIAVNADAIIGKNVNIHKGVTIGQQNRGSKKGAPVIGDDVWIGINTTIVGNVHIGSDVMIGSNCFINYDVPDHSIVVNSGCKVLPKENATEYYINRRIEE